MNHLTKNIITKGWLNISALYKGFVLPYFRYEIRRRGGGDVYSTFKGYTQENLVKDLEGVKEEDIDYIKVYVDWDKEVDKYGKKIYAQLIKRKIEVTLLKEHNIQNIKIDVDIIK